MHGINRLVVIHDTRAKGRSTGGLMTGPRFFDIHARNRSFQSLTFFYFDESTPVAVVVGGKGLAPK